MVNLRGMPSLPKYLPITIYTHVDTSTRGRPTPQRNMPHLGRWRESVYAREVNSEYEKFEINSKNYTPHVISPHIVSHSKRSSIDLGSYNNCSIFKCKLDFEV